MSLKDCMIKNGFTEREIDDITGGKPMNEAQFIETMTLAQKEIEQKARTAKIQMLAIDRAMDVIKNNPNSAAHGLISLLAFREAQRVGHRLCANDG